MAKKRVFVSFDFDNDRILKVFIIGQSKLKDSPFTVIDCSLKEAAPLLTWVIKARRAIRSADLMIVLLGKYTHKASGVLKEVKIAQEVGTPMIQLIGSKTVNYTPIRGAGRVYSWTWDNLKRLLQ